MSLRLLIFAGAAAASLAGCNTGSGDGGASQRAEDAAPPPAQGQPSADGAEGYATPLSVPVTPAQSPQPIPPDLAEPKQH